MARKNLIRTFYMHPQWGYFANIFGVIDFIKDLINYLIKKETTMFHLDSILNMVWLFCISVLLVQLLRLIKEAKQMTENLKFEMDNSLSDFKTELNLVHKLHNLKFKYSGLVTRGNDQKNYPTWLFHTSEFFTDDEFIEAIRKNVLTDIEKNMVIGLGMLKNYSIQ